MSQGFAEHFLQIIGGGVSVFDDIVKQSRANRGRVEAEFIGNDHGHRFRMEEIWLARSAELIFVALFRKFIGTFDTVKICVGIVFLYGSNYIGKRNFSSPAFRRF
jgi:hypothetical protein